MALKMYQEEKEPSISSKSKIGNIVAVASGKGGVGKSTVAVNLALALARMGRKVGLLDADIYGPSIRRMLPEEQLPKEVEGKLIPAVSSGIKVISMAFFRQENKAMVARAPIANQAVLQFVHQVDWGELDDLLIDFPPGTGDIQLTLCQQASLAGAILVTTPQQVAISDVRKAYHMFEQVRLPVIGIVENMSYYFHETTQETIRFFSRGGGSALASELGIPLLETLPVDSDFAELSDLGKSLFQEKPNALLTEAFMQLAGKYVDFTERAKKGKSEVIQDLELVWKEMNHGH